MRADLLLLLEPDTDDDLGLAGAREPLSDEHLVTERLVEALVVAVLPRQSRIDPDRSDADMSEPPLERHGCELPAMSE